MAKHNPERHSWKGRSYKKHGERVSELLGEPSVCKGCDGYGAICSACKGEGCPAGCGNEEDLEMEECLECGGDGLRRT